MDEQRDILKESKQALDRTRLKYMPGYPYGHDAVDSLALIAIAEALTRIADVLEREIVDDQT